MDACRERSLDRSADDALARDRGRDLKRPYGSLISVLCSLFTVHCSIFTFPNRRSRFW